MSRGYVIEDRDGESDLAREVREETVRRLAEEWSALDAQADRASLLREMDADLYEDARETAREQADDEAEGVRLAALAAGQSPEEARAAYKKAHEDYMAKWHEADEEHAAKPLRRMEAIGEVLASLGARMMRPYEHHNEMESYYEYHENRFPDEGEW